MTSNVPALSPWWHPSRHADRRATLLARGRIKAALRQWFASQGFIEVEPGALQVSPGNETHLHAFATRAIASDLSSRDLYLHTSPEFAMKKLLAAGEERIFAFAPCFRNRERGPLHSPEFTMLEWYRAGAPYTMLWDDCAHILAIAANETARATWTHRGRHADVTRPLKHTRVAAAFRDLAGVALDDTHAGATVDRSALAAECQAAGIAFGDGDTWSDIFSRVLVERIEPRLGVDQPEILYAYPLHEAALARPDPTNPNVAERFELYVAGVELANGFGELTEAAEQRRRFETAMADKQQLYGERYPIDEDFLASLDLMPPASGCALGFDRLVMLATGAGHIDDVLWTPHPGERY
ncbi:MAG: EF-P lysine aminoacylase EpmA [Hyphomicrobium sp.]